MATQFDPIAKDESLHTTEATPRNVADAIAEGLKGIEDALPTYTEGDGIDISAQKVISVDTAFTEASTRANIASGDTLATIWGKIKKFFTDLKAVAFSGAAADVTYGSGSVKDALDGLTQIKTYSFSATLGANGTCAIPNLPADLHFVIGVKYSGGGYSYWSVGTINNTNSALMFTNSDGTKMTGTFDITIVYI